MPSKSQPVILHPDGSVTPIHPSNERNFDVDDCQKIGDFPAYHNTADLRRVVIDPFGRESRKVFNPFATKLLAPEIPRRAFIGLGVYGDCLVAPVKYFCRYELHTLDGSCIVGCNEYEPDEAFDVSLSAAEKSALERLVQRRHHLVLTKGHEVLDSPEYICTEGWIQNENGSWEFAIPVA